MVKGISKQVILVQAPETEMYDQAIFILKDNAENITDEMLLREAKRMLNSPKNHIHSGPIWACCGAALTGILWLCTIIL